MDFRDNQNFLEKNHGSRDSIHQIFGCGGNCHYHKQLLKKLENPRIPKKKWMKRDYLNQQS